MLKLWAFKNSEFDLIETYLNDMSEDGKAFKRKFLGFATFEETDTKEYVYATAYRSKSERFDDIKQAWQAEGWDYLCRVEDVLIFRSLRRDYCKRASRTSIFNKTNAWKQAYGKATMTGLLSIIVSIMLLSLVVLIIPVGVNDAGEFFTTLLVGAAAVAILEPGFKWLLLRGRSPEEGSLGDIDLSREHIEKNKSVHILSIVALIVAAIAIIGFSIGEMEFYTGLEYGPIPEGATMEEYINMAENVDAGEVFAHIFDFVLDFGPLIIKILVAVGLFSAIKKKVDAKNEKKRQDYGESDLSRRLSEFREAREAEKIRRADDAGKRIETISYNHGRDDEDEYDEEFDYDYDEDEESLSEKINVDADYEEESKNEIKEIDGQLEMKAENATSDNYENSVEEGEYVINPDFDPSSWDITDAVNSLTNFFEKDLEMKGVAAAIKKADIDNKAEAFFKKIGDAKKKGENSDNVIVRKTTRFITVAIIFTIFMIISGGLAFVMIASIDNSIEVDYHAYEPCCTINEVSDFSELVPEYGYWYYEEGGDLHTDLTYSYNPEWYFDYVYLEPEDEEVDFYFEYMPEHIEVRAWDKAAYEIVEDFESIEYELVDVNMEESPDDYFLDGSFKVLDDEKVYCIYATWDYSDEEGTYYNGEGYFPLVIERVESTEWQYE